MTIQDAKSSAQCNNDEADVAEEFRPRGPIDTHAFNTLEIIMKWSREWNLNVFKITSKYAICNTKKICTARVANHNPR